MSISIRPIIRRVSFSVFSAVLLNFAVSCSRLGLALHTIRDNEQTAAAIGVDPFRYKRLALVLAAALGSRGVPVCALSRPSR